MKFLTKRFVLSAAGIALATWLCYKGKLGGSEWDYALVVAIAGHHAEDIVKAIKNVAPAQTNPS